MHISRLRLQFIAVLLVSLIGVCVSCRQEPQSYVPADMLSGYALRQLPGYEPQGGWVEVIRSGKPSGREVVIDSIELAQDRFCVADTNALIVIGEPAGNPCVIAITFSDVVAYDTLFYGRGADMENYFVGYALLYASLRDSVLILHERYEDNAKTCIVKVEPSGSCKLLLDDVGYWPLDFSLDFTQVLMSRFRYDAATRIGSTALVSFDVQDTTQSSIDLGFNSVQDAACPYRGASVAFILDTDTNTSVWCVDESSRRQVRSWVPPEFAASLRIGRADSTLECIIYSLATEGELRVEKIPFSELGWKMR